MGKQDKYPIKVQLVLPSKILQQFLLTPLGHSPREVHAKTSINFQRGKDIALKPRCAWLMEAEDMQLLSLAYGVNLHKLCSYQSNGIKKQTGLCVRHLQTASAARPWAGWVRGNNLCSPLAAVVEMYWASRGGNSHCTCLSVD